MKPRVMLVNESCLLSTGYSKYGREVLRRWHDSGKYEIAEFATYVTPEHPGVHQLPWKVYLNMPSNQDQGEVQRYQSNPANQFGEFKFNDVCLDYKVHIVATIRDFWMDEHISRSPYRRLFNHVWMPTVDAYPQNEQWLSLFADTDGILTYTDWSGDVLKREGGGKINWLGSAPPCAAPQFRPINVSSIKKELGIENHKIIGTVMRNQRRKLFPNLFKVFRDFLDKSKRKDILLYCHSSYPDFGWDFPKLLNQNKISSKVLFTYVCQNCHSAYPTFFSDALANCIKCGAPAAGMANAKRGVSDEVLANIMNMFDLYVQPACAEGFGIPIVEAAACGVPVMATDYSALADNTRRVNGYPINVKTLYEELETGCFRAIPDQEHFVQLLLEFFSMSDSELREKKRQTQEGYWKHYNWDKTAQKWMDYFDSVDIEKYENLWKSPPRIVNPPPRPEQISTKDYAEWLIVNVLGQPEKLGGYMHLRLLRDLTYNASIGGMYGSYYNENTMTSQQQQYQPFSFEDAYNHFIELAKKNNHYEQLRASQIGH